MKLPQPCLIDTRALLWAADEATRLGAHVERYRTLPLHHRDPFDRLLVAQAETEGLRIISHDPALSLYGIELVW